MDLKKFEQQITKTGFVLENRIAQDLKSAGWTVISNRFYVDDNETTVREIDLVAYRTTKIQHFTVFTSLIISCKKSEANAWTLLSRDIDLKDPNMDWWPLHTWTNDKALKYELGRPGAAKRYHEDLRAFGVTEALQPPTVDVFAFQEMDKKTAAVKNDAAIFGAITSLMKAQSYELSAVPGRRKDSAIYQFNLLSVVDSDLIRLKFDGAGVDASAIDSEQYIGRYIVRKEQTFARIRFIKADKFKQCLADYGRQHNANCKWLSERCDDFYRDILKDWERTRVLEEEFQGAIGYRLSLAAERHCKQKIEKITISAGWNESKRAAVVYMSARPVVLEFLNKDKEVQERTRAALKKTYRYDGPVVFDDWGDMPF